MFKTKGTCSFIILVTDIISNHPLIQYRFEKNHFNISYTYS